MAATLEGAFKIRDQASGTLLKMRTEADATDRSFERLGHRLDSVGSQKQMRQIQDTSRTIRTLGIDAGNAEKRLANVDTRMKNAERSTSGFGARLGLLRKGLTGFAGELFTLARPAGMLVGVSTLIGLAGQGIGALAGTLIAAAPRLFDLGAASAAAIPAVVGLVGGVKELTAAGKLLGQAMQGGAAGARAIREGGPALGQLVRHLRSIRGELRGIKQAGEAPIFRGINSAVGLVSQNRGRLRQLTGTIGGAVGSAVRTVAQGTLGNRGFMGDLQKLASSGGGVVRSLGHDLVNVAHGFASIGVAARPLTAWLSKTVQGWTANWAASMKLKASNGQLTRTFERAKTALQGTFHFIHNVWVALKQLGHDARPAGEQLYHWLGLISDRWASISTNTQRNTRLTHQFFGMTRNFEALARLVGTISKAVFNMGGGQGFGKVANGLNGMIPAAAKFFSTMANTFGPPMVTLLNTFGQTLGLLTKGTDSPLVTILNTTNNILKAFNGLLRAVGPFGGVISHVFEAALLLRFLTKLKLVSVGWDSVAASATRAKIQEREALAAGGGGFGGPFIRPGPVFAGLGGRRGGGPGFFARLFGRGAARAGTAPRFVGGPVGFAEGPAGLARTAVTTDMAAGVLGGGRLAAAGLGGLGALRTVGAAAGRIFLPLTALLGAFGALSAKRSGSVGHQIAQTTFGAVQGASGGLAGAALNHLGIGTGFLNTPEQTTQKLVSESQKLTAADLRHADAGKTGITRLNREIDVLQVTMQGFAHDQTDAARTYRSQLQQEIDQRKMLVGQIKAEQQARETARSDQIAQAFGRIFQQTPGSVATKRAAVERAGVELISRQQSKTLRQRTANDLLQPLRGAARDTLGRRLAPMVGGVFGGGLVEIGGRSERDRIKSAASLPNTVADERVYLNRLIANVIASGFSRLQARAWVGAWVASRFQRNVIPPGAATVAQKARAAAELRAHNRLKHQLVPFTAQQKAAAAARQRQTGPTNAEVIIAAGKSGPLGGFVDAGIGISTAIATMFDGNPTQKGRHVITGNEAIAVGRAARVLAQEGWPINKIEGQFQRWHPDWVRHDIDIVVSSALRNRSRHATGGRLAGRGLQDTVPVPGGMAAPGELIVNRHTERKVNYMLAGHGTSLEGMVDGETASHSARMATGGRASTTPSWHHRRPPATGGRDSSNPYWSTATDAGGRSKSDPYWSVPTKAYAKGGRAGRSGFVNPVPNSSYARVDQGADYVSRGPVLAIGGGVITSVGGGMAGGTGTIIKEQLSSPITVNGHTYTGVYYSEEVALVKQGQKVMAGMPVMGPGGNELGFLDAGGSLTTLVGGLGAGTKPTQFGQDFASFVAFLGGPGNFATPSVRGGRTTPATGTASARQMASASVSPIQLAKNSSYNIQRFVSQQDPGVNFGLGGIAIVGDQPSFPELAGMASNTVTRGKGAGGQATRTKGGGGYPLAGRGGTPTQNEALGRRMMIAHGWAPAQWPFLDTLWSHESGWRTTAGNPTSGAYGIPQSLPASKMADHGSDYRTNPKTQIAWGLDYIAGRYGSPQAAWDFWQHPKNSPPGASTHWYGKGGRTPEWGGWHARGLDQVYNTPTMLGVGEAGPERVTVTKPSKGGKGWGPTNVTFHNKFEIKGGNPAEVRQQIDQALHQFADDLDRHFGSDVADGSGAY